VCSGSRDDDLFDFWEITHNSSETVQDSTIYRDMNRKLGHCAPFRGELRPHLTQRRLSQRFNYPRTKWDLDPSSRLATRDMGQNWVGVGVPFFLKVAAWVPIEHKVAWAEASYPHTKWHLSPSSHLATTDNGRKLRGEVPL